jgi:hypothetical protein
MAKPLTFIDLLAVLPFYPAFVSADLRFVRAFRLFRIFRIAKLGRYSASIRQNALSALRQRNRLIAGDRFREIHKAKEKVYERDAQVFRSEYRSGETPGL